jgi:hypothetical protein
MMGAMLDEPVTTADLLEKWREATRAAELARRLAALAQEASADASASAIASEEIAQMAERAARAAEEAAATARRVADRAAASARGRAGQLIEAEEAETFTAGEEGVAKAAYHDAERDARDRHEVDAKG